MTLAEKVRSMFINRLVTSNKDYV